MRAVLLHLHLCTNKQMVSEGIPFMPLSVADKAAKAAAAAAAQAAAADAPPDTSECVLDVGAQVAASSC